MFSIHFNPQSASKPDHKFGFVIFRTTYGNEYSWDRFMIYLNAQARARMIAEGYADEIPNLDWNVQSSPDLEFASFEEIRKYVIPNFLDLALTIRKGDSTNGSPQARSPYTTLRVFAPVLW
jgi:hypothetical protein